MYFFIAGITTKILLWMFVGAFTHLEFCTIITILSNSKFELPFYLKPLYLPFVKLLNVMDRYTDFKEGQPITYGFFAIGLLIFAVIATIANLLIFPIISGTIFTYMVVALKMKFSKSEEEDATENASTTTQN